MAFAQRIVPNMPEFLSLPIMVLQPASITPDPMKKPLLPKFRIAHPLLIPFEIVRFDLEDLRKHVGCGASR